MRLEALVGPAMGTLGEGHSRQRAQQSQRSRVGMCLAGQSVAA